MTGYKFSQGDLLTTPHTYFFSPTGGYAFLDSYLRARADAILDLTEFASLDSLNSTRLDNWLLAEWRDWIQRGAQQPVPASILTFIKRFAVTKRVWSDYFPDVRPLPTAFYDDFGLYCSVADLCLRSYSASLDLRFMNIALQVDDILIAHRDELGGHQAAWTVALIAEEVSRVLGLLGARRL